MPATVIDIQQLSRRFGQLVAVRDVTLQVERSSIFGLLGPNGSGKSTIIRMLLGILPPSSGSARVLGYDIQRESEAVKRNIGYMSQQFSLYADLTVRENIEFYARIYGLDGAQTAKRMEDVLELTSLEDRIDQLAGTLSGGWKQRLALGCSLVHEPELLFLDEPTAGIDPVARRHLWDLLFRLSARGVTLFITTHYMDEAERCTDVGYLYNSRLLVQGKPSELKGLSSVTPPGTRRFELQVPSPATDLEAVRRMEGVLDATLFGETIHVLASEQLAFESVRQQLARPGAAIREITPTLEDVFVTLTQAAERESEVSAEKAAGGAGKDAEAADQPPPTADADQLSTEEPPAEEPPAEEPPAEEQPAAKTPAKPAPSKQRDASLGGMLAILIKEFAHIRRQPMTLFFMLVIPVMQTIIFGYAIDTQIENIPLVVFDLDGRRHGRQVVEAFENTRRFTVIERVRDDESFRRAMTSGRAKVGIKIPPNYSDRLVGGEQVAVQVLIDGSDSQVATTALNTTQLLGLNLSIGISKAMGEALQVAPARDPAGAGALPIEMRPRLLYNPDLKSSHFFVPGLVGIILQLVTLFLTSFAVVRERELGTLEQLFVTPVGRSGLLLGKLFPYAIVGFVELLIILMVMIYVFGVPVQGSILLLLSLSMLFMICSLGLGLLVSTLARTQLEAVQFAFVIMLPSVLLSGFVFPRSEMPLPIYVITFAIPATYFIEILRGVVLRGADLMDVLPSVLALAACGAVVLGLSVFRFRKQVG